MTRDEKDALLRGRLLAAKTMNDKAKVWRQLDKEDRDDVVHNLHVARRLETQLGNHRLAEAHTALVELAESVGEVGADDLDAMSEAFAKKLSG